MHVEHGTWLSARARLEEELTWRLLRDPADPWIEQQWQAVIDEMKQSDQPEGLARWVVRAMTDLPPGSRKHPAGQLVWFGANLMLGNASVLGEETQSFLDTRVLSYALDRLPRRSVHVARTEQGVLISILQPIEHGFLVEVPATQPIWVQIEPAEGDTQFEPEAVLVHELETRHVIIGAETVRLRWLDGSVQTLGPEQVSTEKFIARNRPPRVQITYDVEVGDNIKQFELPFVMGVLADLSGMPTEPLPSVSDRRFLEIDADNFDVRMRAIRPRVVFWIDEPLGELENPTRLRLDLTFESMESFRPDTFVLQVEPLRERVLARANLSNLLTYIHNKDQAEAQLTAVLRNQARLKQVADTVKRPNVLRSRLLQELLSYHNSHELGGPLERSIDSSLQTLLQLTLNQPIDKGHDLFQHVAALIALTDAQLSSPISAILYHPEFQKLESAWQGLHYLVNNTETNDQIKIRVMNIRKDELAEAMLLDDPEHWDQSPLYKKVYEEELSQFGGEPFGCLVGDFEFDHSPEDVAVLSGLAKVASVAHTVFLSNAKPSLLQMDSWQQLARPRDLLKITQMHEYAEWQELRASPDARHLGLCLPRMLARLPFGARTNPIEAFDFEEETGTENNHTLSWVGSAYGMAANIGKAFKNHGWCAQIRGTDSGGLVENLPAHTILMKDGEVALGGPTETLISDRREADLAQMGLMPLVHWKNSSMAAFLNAVSLHRPASTDDPDSSTNAVMLARLPYVLAINRIAQYVQCIVRDKVGSFRSPDDMTQHLNHWLMQYIDPDPAISDDSFKALRPLAQAHVTIQESHDDRGYLNAILQIQPHYQLPGLTHSLQVKLTLPAPNAA